MLSTAGAFGYEGPFKSDYRLGFGLGFGGQGLGFIDILTCGGI